MLFVVAIVFYDEIKIINTVLCTFPGGGDEVINMPGTLHRSYRSLKKHVNTKGANKFL